MDQRIGGVLTWLLSAALNAFYVVLLCALVLYLVRADRRLRLANGPRPSGYFLRVWIPTFLLVQMLALGVGLAIHEDGLDDCTAPPTDQALAAIGLAGLVSLAIPLTLGALRLRLLPALAGIALLYLPGLFWLSYIANGGECH